MTKEVFQVVDFPHRYTVGAVVSASDSNLSSRRRRKAVRGPNQVTAGFKMSSQNGKALNQARKGKAHTRDENARSGF